MEDGRQLQGRRKKFYLRWLGILYIGIRLDLRSLQILKGYLCLLFLWGVGVGCSTDKQGVNVVNRAWVYVSTQETPAMVLGGRPPSRLSETRI